MPCCAACESRTRLTRPAPPLRTGRGMGGVFSQLLDMGGSFFGDPTLGDQIASKAQGGYAPVTQSPADVAATIAPKVLTALKNPQSQYKPDALALSVSNYALADTARALAAQGYIFAPGSLGAELSKPSVLDAFGGQSRGLVMLGGAALGGLLLLKAFRR
jgi:hypothetical protein